MDTDTLTRPKTRTKKSAKKSILGSPTADSLTADSSAEGVAGVDEAGRGSLAGPVVAAAVILNVPVVGIEDSKKLSPKKREKLFMRLQECARIGVGIVDVETIDKINILQASLLAMQKALGALRPGPRIALVDGKFVPNVACRAVGVVRGDQRSVSIGAASIVAKVVRDRLMRELGGRFPGYGWERNAGYGTQKHKNAIKTLGITPHHRRTFAPVAEFL